ncbi:Hypothetical protein SRAE_1000065900 [Strongyloides ratti]|uniref:Chromo domain-containing protein n=1 Tax=Strongyloides ratti TaxID=34506 RepID=A0A090KY80_STRRB|nr:Hypothetical protein SRAE_1000065900 [Strongyloides ratti]CEF62386.1 Hypothetical protein SRAE_1000065900 [Strongyloides ratti]
MLHKILGKIELLDDDKDTHNIYYLVQWNNCDGPITVQNINLLSEYIKKYAEFESKSTLNHFCDKTMFNTLSNEQVEFLISHLMKYCNDTSFIEDDTDAVEVPQMSIESSLNKDNDICSNDSKCGEMSHSEGINEICCNNDDNIENPVKKNRLFNFSYDEIFHIVFGEIPNSNNYINNNMNDFDREYGSSNSSFLSECNLNEERAFSLEDSFSLFEQKISNMINKDKNKLNGKRNWNTLELISYVVPNTEDGYIGYDTVNKTFEIIEDHEVPDSQRFKINELEEITKIRK